MEQSNSIALLVDQGHASAASVDDVAARTPSTVNAQRGAAAVRALHCARTLADTPPVDFSSRALRPLEIRQALAEANANLQPGQLLQGAGEAIPALGTLEDGRRDTMVDTLERPTTVGVRASEQRLELVDQLGVLHSAVDAATTVRAGNAIEKMLVHQLAASHVAAMNLLAYIPGLQGPRKGKQPTSQIVEIARVGNTAARLMEVCIAGAQVLQRLKTGGTQRVVVQHQQVVVAGDAPALVVNEAQRKGGRRARRRGSQDGR